MKAASRPAKTFSQTFRIQTAPSDSTTSSLASNKPFRVPNRARRAAKSEVPPAPSVALVLPRLPGLRIPALGRAADDGLRLAGLRRAVLLLAGDALDLAREHRNDDADEIPELAARRFIAVGTDGGGAEALRPGRDLLARQTQRAVQREAAAALAAAAVCPIDPERTEA